MPPRQQNQQEKVANCKFVEWLEEFSFQASEKNNQNMYFVYRKAAMNLRKEHFPIPVKQLIKVSGIGATIVKKMELKLKLFLESGGTMQDLYADGILPLPDAVSTFPPSTSATTDDPPIDESSTDLAVLKKKRATVPKAPRVYMPAYRSGAYSILMGMYKIGLDGGKDDLLTRNQISTVAQQYCDASFAQGSSSNSSYSAWSSMSTLSKKDLVFKRGSPAKYCLTVEGRELAEKLWARTESMKNNNDGLNEPSCSQSSVPTALTSTATTVNLLSIKEKEEQLENISKRLKASSAAEFVFYFDYMDDDNNPISSKDDAAISLYNQDFACTFKIRFHHYQARHPFCMKISKESNNPDNSGYLYGYIRDQDAPETAPGIPLGQIEIYQRQNLSEISTLKKRALSVSNSITSEANLFHDYSVASKLSSKDLTPWPEYKDGPAYELKWEGNPLPIVLAPNDYDIVLLVDSREKRSMSDRQHIQQFLERVNILHSTRALEVGDISWIARSKYPGPSGKPIEIVLDFIIERKRLDDLVSSIKSGRFKEQKVFYLIEDLVGCTAVEAFGHDKIRCAMSLAQVLDDVHIQRVKSFEEFLEFLQRIHQIVLRSYQNKSVFALPSDILEKKTFLNLKKAAQERDKRLYHLTYSSFCELNSKSKALTLKDLWMKMLLCIRGLSADKAIRIIEKYPTPRSFMVALETQVFREEKIKIFKNLDMYVSKNKIGDALAKKIIDMFELETYPDEPALTETQ